MKNHIKKLAVLLLATSFLFVGCSDDDDNPTTPSLQKANVKVVHASPDAPGVDLLVDNNVAGANLTFPNNTGYLEVEEGTRNIKVNVSGTSTTVIEADLPIEGNKNYSVFAVDAVANLSPLVIEDDLTSPASGNVHVRFIHLSPDAPAVDITTKDGTVVFGNYDFKKYSAFPPLPAGSSDFQVRFAGTETVVLHFSGIALSNGSIYTVFAKGFVSGTGAQALGAEIIVNK
jgi:major membrane immunogen (membrane-anchored lipoprotein)